MTWYCDYAIGDPLHGPYHDREYGFVLTDESELFQRLVLEINQAGLNWGLILKKRLAFNSAFQGYDVSRIARYDEQQRQRLLNDAAIIRNRLKIDAVIHNAGVVESMRDSHGGFDSWLREHHPMTKPEWVKLFKKTFKFTGVEITGEFLMSTGFLPGTHRHDCPAYKIIAKSRPPWSEVPLSFYNTE